MVRMPQHNNELWEAYFSSRSDEDRNALVVAHLPQAERQAIRKDRCTPPSVEYDDLYSAACVGLIAAIEKYDPETGVPEVGFIASSVSFAMGDWLREVDHVGRRVTGNEYPEMSQLDSESKWSLDFVLDEDVVDDWCGTADPRWSWLTEEVSKLEADGQMSLMLRYRMGMTNSEAACVMGLSDEEHADVYGNALLTLKKKASDLTRGIEGNGQLAI